MEDDDRPSRSKTPRPESPTQGPPAAAEPVTAEVPRPSDPGSTTPLDPPPPGSFDATLKQERLEPEPPPPARAPLAAPFDSSRFPILKRLGSGAFGVVYLVRDLLTGDEVALKTISSARQEVIYRLKNEFRALTGLRHENVVSFYELFAEDEDRAYFTMEYVPGTNFLDHVRPTGVLDEQRLRAALAQLVNGLSVLHAARKLHRDVKPSNVMVTPAGRVVLLDFGLVTEALPSSVGRSIELAGTPEYMAPEHQGGESVSTASDWYSVGVMLYHALTGQLPFKGTTWQQLLEQKRVGRPPPPAQVAGAPADLSDLSLGLLISDAARRAGPAEIAAVLGAIQAGAQSALPQPPLVGRKLELAQLDAALERVRSGEGATVLLGGSSGVGKTSLVEFFLEQAERRTGATVLRGRCYERETVPYQGIDSLIDDLCRLLNADRAATDAWLPPKVAALVRLFPALSRVPAIDAQRNRGQSANLDSQEVRRQAFGALRKLLERVAEKRLLILHIDDLQWGDLDTAKLLIELVRPPDAPTLLLVLGFRAEDRDRSRCLQALTGEAIGTPIQIHLGPLAAEDADALLRAHLPTQLGAAEVAQLTRGADGNPFLLRELAHFAGDPDAGWKAGEPLDIHHALRARIARLPPTARMLLETIAVAGHPVPEKAARSAAGIVGSLWEDWHLLHAQHLVRLSGPSDDRQLEPFHDRIREAVVAEISDDRAREIHRRLAGALEATGSADPEVLARHHEAAGNMDQALDFATKAAKQADHALAFDRAARLYRRAVDLSRRDDPQRLKLLAALSEALANAGRCIEAALTFQEAARGESADERIRLRGRAAEQYLSGGQIDQGRRILRDDLREQGFAFPTSRRAVLSLLWHRKRLRYMSLKKDRADTSSAHPDQVKLLDHVYKVSVGLSFVDALIGGEMATRFMIRALQLGEPHLIARGICLITGHSAIEGPESKRTEYLLEQMQLHGNPLGDRAVDGSMLAVRGLRGYFGGNWNTGLEYLDKAEKVFREDCPGMVWELWTARAVAIWSLFFLGRWGELQQRVAAGLREGQERGNLYAVAGMCSPFGIAAWLARNDVEGAKRSLTDVQRSWSVRGRQFQAFWFLMADSFIQLYVGDGPTAWARLNGSWKVVASPAVTFRFPMLRLQLLHMRGACALAAAAMESPGSEAARKLTDEAARAARDLERVKLPHAHALAELLRAGVAAQRGAVGEALKHAAAAVQGLEHQRLAVYAAAAQRQLSRLNGERPPSFLPGETVADPDAVTRMVAPGFPDR